MQPTGPFHAIFKAGVNLILILIVLFLGSVNRAEIGRKIRIAFQSISERNACILLKCRWPAVIYSASPIKL